MSDKFTCLRDFCTFEYGASLPSQLRTEGNVSVVGSAGFVGSHNMALEKGPGIVIGRKGTVGQATWVKNDFWPIDTTYFITPRPNVNLRWLYFLLDWLPLKRLDSATGVPGLNRNDAYKLRVQYNPSNNEQIIIASILDAIDDAILETDALIDKLYAIGSGMAEDLFCFGLDSNGELRSLDMLADSAIGTIPSDWTVNRLDTIFGVFGGKRLPAGHNYALEATDFRYLRVTDFFSEVSRVEQLPSLEARTFKALQRYEIKDGSLAVSIAGSIGRFHPFRNETALSVILTENAARLEPKKSINPDFYARFLNSLPIQKQVELEIGTGGGVPKLALHRIQALKIVDVPRDEQDEISRRLDALDTEIEAYCIERDKLAALRNGLRDDLLTGRVSVERLTETAASPLQSGE